MKHFNLAQAEAPFARPGQSGCCADALELPHIEFVDRAIAAGWSEADVAEAMLWRAVLHVQVLNNSDIYDDVRQVLAALFARAS